MRFGISATGMVCIAAGLLCQTADVHPQVGRLRADLNFLSSDVLAGRASLSREADIAARYIAADFERTGLRPANGSSYLQEFAMIGYRADPSKRKLALLRANARKEFKPGTEFTAAFSRDVHLEGKQVAFAGYGITAPEYSYDDYANLDVKGKVVLIFDHEPQEDNPQSVFNGTGHTLHAGRSTKVANARRHGAIAVLIASEPLRKHRGLVEGSGTAAANQGQPQRASAPPQSLDDDKQIPAFSISDSVFTELIHPLGRSPVELQKSIEEKLQPQSANLDSTRVDLGSGNTEQHRGVSLNAAGLLEGSDPALKSETVLVMAHYDHLGLQNGHVYPGANDNASGTVAVMELARLFQASGKRPKRSILFLVFGSEEQLMMGSFYYTAHPLRPLAGTRAALNLDMIGRDEAHIPQSQGVLQIPADTSNGLNLVGAVYSPSLLSIIERENKQVGLSLDTKFDRDHQLNALFRCDHLPFLMEGIPAVWFFGGFHPGYHEPSDTVEKLNFPKMEKVIRLAYLVTEQIANSADTPRFKNTAK